MHHEIMITIMDIMIKDCDESIEMQKLVVEYWLQSKQLIKSCNLLQWKCFENYLEKVSLKTTYFG